MWYYILVGALVVIALVVIFIDIVGGPLGWLDWLDGFSIKGGPFGLSETRPEEPAKEVSGVDYAHGPAITGLSFFDGEKWQDVGDVTNFALETRPAEPDGWVGLAFGEEELRAPEYERQPIYSLSPNDVSVGYKQYETRVLFAPVEFPQAESYWGYVSELILILADGRRRLLPFDPPKKVCVGDTVTLATGSFVFE